KKGLRKSEDRMVVREDRRIIWPVVARVFCAHVAGHDLDEAVYQVLLAEFGETNPYDGSAWPRTNEAALRNLLHNPVAWGHRVMHWYYMAPNGRRRKRPGQSSPRWAYDTGIAPPEPIKIWRNVHEPLWTGEDAARLIAELNYRKDIVAGKASPIAQF